MSILRRGSRALSVLGGVVVLAACTGSSDGHKLPDGGAGSCASQTSSFDDQNYLLQGLTTAVQGKDRAAFLKLAGTPAAEQAMSMWWRNLSALGFTTGAVSPVLGSSSTDGDHALTFEIGVHNALDPIDDDKRPLPHVPAARYRLTTAHSKQDCTQALIASWKPLSAAPWDSAKPLTVVKTAHTVVAGDAAIAAQVRRVARLAEKAATWDFQFFGVVDKTRYLEQKGFVTFVAANNREAATWFRTESAPKPRGWTADPGNVAGFEYPMPGVQVWPSLKNRHDVSASPTGGSRVVINPSGVHQSDTTLEATLVHEYVHALLRVNDLWSWGSGDPVPAATAEGAARWFEAMFYSNPATANGTLRSLNMLRPVIESRPFSGKVPSDQQIYGAASQADYYYDVSASAFSYLAAAYGAGFAVQSIVDAYLNGGGPFGGVVDSVKGATITFENPSVVERRWAGWVRNGFPLPAPK